MDLSVSKLAFDNAEDGLHFAANRGFAFFNITGPVNSIIAHFWKSAGTEIDTVVDGRHIVHLLTSGFPSPCWPPNETPCATNRAVRPKQGRNQLVATGLASGKNPAGRITASQSGIIHKWESRPRQDMTICRCPPEQVPINLFHFYICAVLSGNGIALLLTPGTGISKPLTVNKRHDTDGRWRQMTKLPRPCPQYPPFTLRYGNMTGPSFAGGSWRFRHYHCRSQTLRVPARAFDVILSTGQDREDHLLVLPGPQAVVAPVPGPLADPSAPRSGRNLNTDHL